MIMIVNTRVHSKRVMTKTLTHRKATIEDVKEIIALLLQDEIGKTREDNKQEIDKYYIEAFNKIDCDIHQYLMVVKRNNEIVGTCHLTIMPSLTFRGSTRMQIEVVRIAEKHRREGIGKWMMKAAISYGKSEGASIIQLVTNKKRLKAKVFYEKLGFEASHIGMKLYLEDEK